MMDIGTWEDVRHIERLVSQGCLVDVLRDAQPGWFSPRKWNFWHYGLGLAHRPEDIPPLPVRRVHGS